MVVPSPVSPILQGCKKGSNKTFPDGYTATQRLNFGGKTTSDMLNTIEFTTSGAASVTLWWVAGEADRYMAIYDAEGNIIASSEVGGEKNAMHITELKLNEAGTYYIGVPNGSNYLFRAEVQEMSNENPKDGDALRIVIALLAVSAMGIALLPRKKEF